MKMKRPTYRNDGGEIAGDLRKISRPRWLPSPAALAAREPKQHVKVTLDLSEHAVAFFKREARRHGGSYQRMIRRLVDAYVEKAG
jgi:predicted DNA binding CopG/RHH family protein